MESPNNVSSLVDKKGGRSKPLPTLPANMSTALPRNVAAATRRAPACSRRMPAVYAGKKGKKGGGGGGGGAGKPARKKNEVSEGRAYEQETRKTILSFGKLKKTVSGGKQVLKDVSLSMYLGAKIGVLGCKSTADHP